MVAKSRAVALGTADDPDLRSALARLASDAHAPDEWNRMALVSGWEGAVDQALEDGLLTETEERHIEAFIPRFDLAPKDLNVRGALERLGKAKVLRDLVEHGRVPEVGPVDGLPFNLMKSESLVWLFKDVAYHELRTPVSSWWIVRTIRRVSSQSTSRRMRSRVLLPMLSWLPSRRSQISS
jgi:hypothetical protein